MTIQTIQPARPVAMHDMFEAWLIGGKEAHRLTVTGETLAEIAASAAQSCQHKDHFIVKQTNRVSGEALMHVYYVKQRPPQWVRKPGFAHAVQIRPLDAELRFSMPVHAFAPVEAFRWTPGADVVGKADFIEHSREARRGA